MPSLKERLENIVIVVLTTAIAAFSAGFASRAAIAGTALLSGRSDLHRSADWKSVAKGNGWINKNRRQEQLGAVYGGLDEIKSASDSVIISGEST
ncbi:MAG: hypothetical protein JO217_07600 [Acidobacteriaceae bacterium]|nr:hypothetical protein [Acidobacteriaceae bacterium]